MTLLKLLALRAGLPGREELCITPLIPAGRAGLAGSAPGQDNSAGHEPPRLYSLFLAFMGKGTLGTNLGA
jgi:hypothetical protein